MIAYYAIIRHCVLLLLFRKRLIGTLTTIVIIFRCFPYQCESDHSIDFEL